MNILGDIVTLKALEFEDNEMLLEIINDPETEGMLGGWSFPVSKGNQEIWLKNLTNNKETLRCSISVNDKSIGVIILTDIDYKNGNAEVHIKLRKGNYRGKGYGTDAINAITNYCFKELRLVCVYSRVNQNNLASIKLFEKCGFLREGTLKKRVFKKGDYLDVISFSKIGVY